MHAYLISPPVPFHQSSPAPTAWLRLTYRGLSGLAPASAALAHVIDMPTTVGTDNNNINNNNT